MKSLLIFVLSVSASFATADVAADLKHWNETRSFNAAERGELSNLKGSIENMAAWAKKAREKIVQSKDSTSLGRVEAENSVNLTKAADYEKRAEELQTKYDSRVAEIKGKLNIAAVENKEIELEFEKLKLSATHVQLKLYNNEFAIEKMYKTFDKSTMGAYVKDRFDKFYCEAQKSSPCDKKANSPTASSATGAK